MAFIMLLASEATRTEYLLQRSEIRISRSRLQLAVADSNLTRDHWYCSASEEGKG